MYPFSQNNESNALMDLGSLNIFESDEDFKCPLSEREFEGKEKSNSLQSEYNYKIEKIIPLDEKTTANGTNNQELFLNQYKKEADSFKNFNSYDKISQLLESHKIDKILLSKFNKDIRIEEAENYLKLIPRKRKRKKNKNDPNENEIFVYIPKFGMGRKTLKDPSKRKHNKFSSDNLIKKIKSNLFQKLILFVNNMLKNKYKIRELDYIFIDTIKKEINLELLEMTIKDLLSKDISPKYSNFPPDSNKKVIETIFEKEKDNEAIMFIFNITFRDWIDIFILKKKVKDFGNLSEESCQEIEENLPKLEKLLEDILKDSNEEYFSSFIFSLYNYERWFSVKRVRRQKKKE